MRRGLFASFCTLVLALVGQSAAAGVEILVKNSGKTDFKVFSATLEPAGLGGDAKIRVEGWTTVPARRTRTIRSTGNSSAFAVGFANEHGFHPLDFSNGDQFDSDFPALVAVRPGTDFRLAYSDGNAAFPEGFMAAAISAPMKVPANGRYQIRLNVDLDEGAEQGFPFLDLSSAAIRRHMQIPD